MLFNLSFIISSIQIIYNNALKASYSDKKNIDKQFKNLSHYYRITLYEIN